MFFELMSWVAYTWKIKNVIFFIQGSTSNDAIISWYETLYLVHCPKKANDDKYQKHFKMIYKKLKKPKKKDIKTFWIILLISIFIIINLIALFFIIK